MVAGAGGVLYGPGGNLESTFAWSIGHSSNNQVEAYALLQGLILAKAQGITVLTVSSGF
jgi:ribonuclease HI